jgi:nitroreductase
MHDLLKLIKERQSTRTPYDPERPVTKGHLARILEAGSWAPTAHNMQNFEIMVVDDKETLDMIKNIQFPASETFIRENYLQLSFSEEELERKKTGVLGTMFPKSWLHPVFVPKGENEEEEEEHPLTERHNQMLDCATLVLVLYDPRHRAPASEGDFLGIMSIGCVLENMWLMATALGIGFHVVSALSGFYTENEIKKMLHIPDHLSIAISFRLGYPTAVGKYLRVRRDVEDFTHYNQYGNRDIGDEMDFLNQ